MQDLRGADATLLEVQVPDLWKLPLGQVDLLNVLDLFELHSTEGCPKSLRAGLQSFADRTVRAIQDLPRGSSYDGFVGELGKVDGSRIPSVVRTLLSEEAERRDHAATRELLERLETVRRKLARFSTVSRNLRVEADEQYKVRVAALRAEMELELKTRLSTSPSRVKRMNSTFPLSRRVPPARLMAWLSAEPWGRLTPPGPRTYLS